MTPFILSQLAIILFALFIGVKESVTILERRDYVPINSPYDDPYHFFGALAACVVGAICTLYQNSIEAYLFMPFLCFLWYSTVYDIVIGKEAFSKWYYLGSTSKMDAWYKNKFGVFAGMWKAGVSVFVILVLNLIYFL
jgi:hypothetical protein